jgi:hypothetical protein
MYILGEVKVKPVSSTNVLSSPESNARATAVWLGSRPVTLGVGAAVAVGQKKRSMVPAYKVHRPQHGGVARIAAGGSTVNVNVEVW